MLKEKLEELEYDNSLNNEEIKLLHRKIDALEYQNVVNLVRLEEFAIKEEDLQKKIREYQNKEQKQNER